MESSIVPLSCESTQVVMVQKEACCLPNFEAAGGENSTREPPHTPPSRTVGKRASHFGTKKLAALHAERVSLVFLDSVAQPFLGKTQSPNQCPPPPFCLCSQFETRTCGF